MSIAIEEQDEAQEAPAVGDDVIWSPSRLTLAGKCGAAYKYQYVDKVGGKAPSGALVLGNVIHNAVEQWYGEEGDGFKETSLRESVKTQWHFEVSPEMNALQAEMWDAYQVLELLAHNIVFKRPTIKAPRATKEYLSSAEYGIFNEKKIEMLELADEQSDQIVWSKSETAWDAYIKSLEIADKMEARWKHQPRPLIVEESFTVELGDFRVRGRIDQLRRDVDKSSGEFVQSMVDIKTGKNPLTQMEAFLQSFIYHEAVRQWHQELPPTDRVSFYLARFDEYQTGRIDYERHKKMALQILSSRQRMVTTQDFAPSFGYGCKLCDFSPYCADDIGLWSEDGKVLDLIPDAVEAVTVK